MKGAHFKKDREPERLEGQLTLSERLFGKQDWDTDAEEPAAPVLPAANAPVREAPDLSVREAPDLPAHEAPDLSTHETPNLPTREIPDLSISETVPGFEEKDETNTKFSYIENDAFWPAIEETLHDLGLDDEEIQKAKERAEKPQPPAEEPAAPPPFIPTSSLEASIKKLESELEAAGEPLIPPTRDSQQEAGEPLPMDPAQTEVRNQTEKAITKTPEEAAEPESPEEAPAAEEAAEPESPEEAPAAEDGGEDAGSTRNAEIPTQAIASAEPLAEAKGPEAAESAPAPQEALNAAQNAPGEPAIEKTLAEIPERAREETEQEADPESEEPPKKKKKAIAILYDWLEEIIFAVVIVVVVFSFLFRVVTVQGTSMENTFSGGDKLIVSSFIYKIKPGDVIVAVDVLEDPIIKRVIATEGQEVYIDNETGSVYVDGEKLDESAYTQNGITYARGGGRLVFPAVVPENCVFVLGDNRIVSKDSRFEDVGMISYDHILGKAEFQVFPFSEIHLIR